MMAIKTIFFLFQKNVFLPNDNVRPSENVSRGVDSATDIPHEDRDSVRVSDRVMERKGHVCKDIRDFQFSCLLQRASIPFTYSHSTEISLVVVRNDHGSTQRSYSPTERRGSSYVINTKTCILTHNRVGP